MATRFEIIDKPVYIAELTSLAEAAQAGDRLTAVAMTCDASDPAVAGMLRAWAAAAKRGAHVRLIIDAMSFMLDDADQPGPMLLRGAIKPTALSGTFIETYRLLEALRQNGGSYVLTNHPTHALSFPYSGRWHGKFAVINGRAYLGSCNLTNTNKLEVMVRAEDATLVRTLNQLADQLYKGYSNTCQTLGGDDQRLRLSPTSELCIDSGKRGQSTILDYAHQLIDEAAQTLTITCQYYPGGETARRLAAAGRRGVQVRVFHSHPTVHGRLTLLHRLYNWRENLVSHPGVQRYRLPSRAPKLHAKVLFSESAALIGSHNYVSAGVRFGTGETAIHSTDSGFIQRLKTSVDRLVQPYIDSN